MGHRLSKIYTRTGDKGDTGLGDGSRVDKDSARVEAYGTVDELNSHIGVILSCDLPEDIRNCLVEVQHDLFDLGSELSMPGYTAMREDYIQRLEQQLDSFNADLPMLKEFILPAGAGPRRPVTSRDACVGVRNAGIVTLMRSEMVNPHALVYLNRLSDLLFVTARVLARFENGAEVLWRPHRHDR